MKLLINSYFMCNFNYSPLKIHKKEHLLFLRNDNISAYKDLWMWIHCVFYVFSMKVSWLCISYVKISKIINNLNYYERSFCTKKDKETCKRTTPIKFRHTRMYVFFGSKVWNTLPYHIRSFENSKSFWEVIKNQNGTFCTCIVCTK